MKKAFFVLAIAVLAVGMVSAQNWGNPWGVAQTVTVEGTLGLQNGNIVLTSGDTVYFVPMLSRYVGFVEGLREGARVSVQGYAGSYNMLMPVSFTVGGKSYDVSGYAGGGYGMMGGGRGMGGYSHCW